MDPSILLSAGLTAGGLVFALLFGIGSGSIVGALMAGGGLAVACYSMWKGMQKEGQGQAAISMLLIVASIAIGGLLLLLKIWHWIK